MCRGDVERVGADGAGVALDLAGKEAGHVVPDRDPGRVRLAGSLLRGQPAALAEGGQRFVQRLHPQPDHAPACATYTIGRASCAESWCQSVSSPEADKSLNKKTHYHT